MNDSVILLVEDNRDDVLLTIRALQKSNIHSRIIVVGDGQEALDYLFRQGKFADRDKKDVPTLVLLDLNLPRLSGLEVLERIRANVDTQCLPIVILTSSKEEQDIVKSYRHGVNSYIQKPVDLSEFIDVIRHMGIYWLIYNISPLHGLKK